jgi:hypothetical protein
MHSDVDTNTGFENAAMMVDICRDEYLRQGFRGAEVLRGVEVTDESAAHLALMLVETLPRSSRTEGVRSMTVDALRALVRPKYLQRAS